MAGAAKKPLTPAEQRAQRVAALDWQQQMQANSEAERAARQAEHDAFMQRVRAWRDAEAAARERGEELPPVAIPRLDGIMTEKREAERLEAERLEAERLAAISPRDTLISALPSHKQEAIAKWERIRKQQFPLEALPYL